MPFIGSVEEVIIIFSFLWKDLGCFDSEFV